MIGRVFARSVFWVVLLVVAAVGFALLASSRFGNVAIFLPPYRIDLSINLAVVLLLVGFAVLYIIVRLISWAGRMPERVRLHRLERRSAQAHEALRASLAAWMEGRFARSEREAKNPALTGDAAVLSALTAARSAHAMHEFERRDQWIVHARQAAEGLKGAHRASMLNAVLVTQSDMLVEQQHGPDALAALEQLKANGARHVRTMQLLLRANQQCGHWHEVLRIARQLEKRGALHPLASAKIRAEACAALFAELLGDVEAIRGLWNGLPAAERLNPAVAAAAARAFNRSGDGRQAATILEAVLEQNWDAQLVRLYAQCALQPPTPLIERAEEWLKRYPSDPQLFATLGVLCARAGLWGKAQHFLEDSLRRDESAWVRLEIARMFEASGRPERAHEHYRLAALALSADAPDAKSLHL